MQILKVISLLLDYPEEALRSAHKELDEAICSAREISPDQRGSLLRLLDELAGDELMDVQERYTELFDRGRALSLLLWMYGGVAGGVSAAIMLPAAMVYSMVNAPRSLAVLACAVTTQILYMAAFPFLLIRLGAAPAAAITERPRMVMASGSSPNRIQP